MTDTKRALTSIKFYRGGLLTILASCNFLVKKLAALQISQENIAVLEMWCDKLGDLLDKIRIANNEIDDEIYDHGSKRKTEYAGDDNLKILEHIKMCRETRGDFIVISSAFCDAVEENILIIPNLEDRVEISKYLEKVKFLKQEVESFWD